jgi:hypothetical protein
MDLRYFILGLIGLIGFKASALKLRLLFKKEQAQKGLPLLGGL